MASRIALGTKLVRFSNWFHSRLNRSNVTWFLLFLIIISIWNFLNLNLSQWEIHIWGLVPPSLLPPDVRRFHRVKRLKWVTRDNLIRSILPGFNGASFKGVIYTLSLSRFSLIQISLENGWKIAGNRFQVDFQFETRIAQTLKLTIQKMIGNSNLELANCQPSEHRSRKPSTGDVRTSTLKAS